jgi:hypothetical protein
MALRRQVVSHDDWARKPYGTISMINRSPRKWTTNVSTNAFQDTNLRLIPQADGHTWIIGKKLIPYQNGDSVWEYAQYLQTLRVSPWQAKDSPYVHELDVARVLRPNVYRIVFARLSMGLDGKVRYQIISKIRIEHRPAEALLIVEPNSMTILDVIWG